MKNINLKLLIASLFVAVATSQSAMALEQINSENGYDPMARNGRLEQGTDIPVASFRSHEADSLKFSGGSENDTGNVTSNFSEHGGHESSNNPNSIDYMSKN